MWYQLEVAECRRESVEHLSELLEETGALSVTLADKHDDPVLEPEPGTTPLWPCLTIQALYHTEPEALHAKASLLTDYPQLHVSISTLQDKAWERVCMDDFKPQQFGKRLWICPSWSPLPDPTGVHCILDPGLAFGTGTHPTTALCLTWLEQANLTQQTVIDFGCGSGILTVAALKLGAGFVYAIDIDEQALQATQDNATRNGLTETHLRVGSTSILRSHAAHVIIANILLQPLMELTSYFHELLASDGKLVVSGLLDTQTADIILAYEGRFILRNSYTAEGWSLLVFQKTVYP